MKKVLVILICTCTLLFSGCVIYEHIQSDINAAGDFAKEFCLSLATDNIEKSKEYLSSTYSAPNKEYFEKHIAMIESYNGIDFSDGIDIKNCLYNGKVSINGTYEFVFETLVGEKEIDLFFTVIKNEDRYEIFSFGANPPK